MVLIQNSSGSQQNPGSSNTEQGRRGGNLSTVQKFKRSLQHSFSKLGKQKILKAAKVHYLQDKLKIKGYFRLKAPTIEDDKSLKLQ